MSHCAKIVFLLKCLDVKNGVLKWKLHFFVFVFFCVGDRETEKEKMEKAKKTYKNSVLKGALPIIKEKGFSSKTCLTLFVSGRVKNAHFSAHYLL